MVAYPRLPGALERWRLGGCGALPITRGAEACTLLLVTAAALLMSFVFVTALLLSVSETAPLGGIAQSSVAIVGAGHGRGV